MDTSSNSTETENIIYKWNSGHLTLKMNDIINKSGLDELSIRGNPETEVPVLTFGFNKCKRRIMIDSGLDNSRNPMGLFGQCYQPRVEKDFIAAIGEMFHDVYLTHLHSDHVGNLCQIRYRTVVAHSMEIEYAFKGGRDYLKKLFKDITFQELFPEQFYTENYPYKCLDHFGDGSFIILHTPGHTPGHLSYLYKINGFSVLFAGDLCEGYLGLKYPPQSGNFSQLLYENSIQSLLEWMKQDRKLILLSSHEIETDKLMENGINDISQLEILANYQESKMKQLKLY